ncbi:uncharacterized protein, YkwD family [Caldanaerovirga acetigignens]|uniref:Uncharacterized protein, YkwD family n=1 Tax=Caldanaerovirga acetigignens TaxID=447595 RepID=A0A1M7GUV4_9FIRM|nr:CAP domain-containing protein [Caldanaerovirga acetigignens]SHM19986.1 uncharacterized protein, YkwD family [Caldanaerovirga acetigignens]
MKKTLKYFAALILIVFLAVLPAVAFASGWVNLKVTYNGTVKVFRIPIESVLKSGKYMFTLNVSKFFELKPQNQSNTQDSKPNDKQETTQVQGLTADEKQMLDLVNAERTKAGLKPLQIDMRLVELARKKSKDMILNNYFGHTSPVYGTPFDMMKSAGITYKYAGENLAGAPNVFKAHEGLMNSPGHRANILSPNYNRIGIGVVEGGPYGKMFTQLFIGTE